MSTTARDAEHLEERLLNHLVDYFTSCKGAPIRADALLVADLHLDDWRLFELYTYVDDHVPGFALPEQLDLADARLRDVSYYAARQMENDRCTTSPRSAA